MHCIAVVTYKLNLGALLLDVFNALPFERRLRALRSILDSCFFSEMGFSEECWSKWERSCIGLGATRRLIDLEFYKGLSDEFKTELSRHSESYMFSVPLLELDAGFYVGPGIACLEIELEGIDGSDKKVLNVLSEKLRNIDVSKLYRFILATIEIPWEYIEASHSVLHRRNQRLRERIVETFDVTLISVLCKDCNDVYVRTELLEAPPIGVRLDLGKAKKCSPTDLDQLLELVDLYVAISSRYTISSLAMVLDLLGSATSREILGHDLNEVEYLIEALHDAMLSSRRMLVKVRELEDFLQGKASRYSELVEEHGRYPNKNLERCIVGITTLARPRSKEEYVKIFRDACGYGRTLRNLETALEALIRFLDNTYSGLFTISSIRGLREQLRVAYISIGIALATAIASIALQILSRLLLG